MPSLPNTLSLLRIALIPVLVYLLTDTGPIYSLFAALVFFVASITDMLDGYLARRQGLTTSLGQLLDPLADKLLVASALIMLAAADRLPRIPSWLVVIIIGRELAVTGLRGLASSVGVILPAEELGKYKMLFQVFALHGLLIHYQYFSIDFYLAGLYFLWISVVLSVWSGVDYHVKAFRRILARPATPVSSTAMPARQASLQR